MQFFSGKLHAFLIREVKKSAKEFEEGKTPRCMVELVLRMIQTQSGAEKLFNSVDMSSLHHVVGMSIPKH